MSEAGLAREILLRDLFDELADADDTRRAEVLAERDITDEGVISELDTLISADRRVEQEPLLSPGWLARLGTAATQRLGQHVGEFAITELLGSGGMGDVFLAERADGAFEQTVAIKLVRRDLATPAAIERFSHERQILARLNHPNIATLHGGGLTEDGRPYLVMEYVDGEPLNRYCIDDDLPVGRRLELFASACRAVAHAHARLTVHCDLKPDNILVNDDVGVRLLDFGIATALEADAPRFGAAMTPAYAAPEVLDQEPVTTSADVYSLGVILYELLGDELPYGLDHLTLPERAERVRTTPVPLARGPRDLAAICRKAMAPDPSNRYDSAAALADDVERFVQRRPVLARGRSWSYVAAKLVQRHAVATVGAAIAVAVIAALIVVYTRGMATERDRARAESARAHAVSNVLIGMLTDVDPTEVRGEPLTARRLLARAESRLGEELDAYPEERARIVQVLGQAHYNLGHYADAERVFRSMLAAGGERDADSARRAELLTWLGNALREQSKFDEAEKVVAEAVELRERTHGPDSIQVADALLERANLAIDLGRYDDALALAERARAIHKKVGDSSDQMRSVTIVASAQSARGEYVAAEPLSREALEASIKTNGETHPRTADLYLDVGYALRKQGKLDDAEPFYRSALDIREKLYEGDHADLAHSLNHLARLLHQQGKPAEAEPIYGRALAMRRRLYGDAHAAVTASLAGLAQVLIDLDRLAEATPLTKEAYEIVQRLYGDDHPYVAAALGTWAHTLWLGGQRAEAIEMFRGALVIARKVHAPDHLGVASATFRLGKVLCEVGAAKEGRVLLEEAAKIRAAKLTADHPLRVRVADAMTSCN
jgi:serine/threonine-protein kinase